MLAERHVADALRHVERQRRIVAELDRDGHDVTTARTVLATFIDSLNLQQRGRERMLREIDG